MMAPFDAHAAAFRVTPAGVSLVGNCAFDIRKVESPPKPVMVRSMNSTFDDFTVPAVSLRREEQ